MQGIGIALLRGINVGGHGKLPMADLRSILTGLGATDVRTYIQSGNAVFRGDLTGQQVSAAVEAGHGFAPRCLVLSLEDYERCLSANPFRPATEDSSFEPRTLHLYFLDGTPAPVSKDTLAAAAPTERLAVTEGVAWLFAPNGIGRSKLAPRLEKALGIPATARNWASAIAIRDLARGLGT